MYDFDTDGHQHLCDCGAVWTDSDGGPCHKTCQDCKLQIETEDFDSTDYCSTCRNKHRKEDEDGMEVLSEIPAGKENGTGKALSDS